MSIVLLAAMRLSLAAPQTVERPATQGQPVVASLPLSDVLTLESGASCLARDRLLEHLFMWTEQRYVDGQLRIHVVGDARLARRIEFSLLRGDRVVAVRRFEAAPADCEELHAVVGLALAMAIDATSMSDGVAQTSPLVRREQVPPLSHSTATTRRDRRSREDAKRASLSVSSSRSPVWRGWLALLGRFSAGAPPGAGGGAQLRLGSRRREVFELGVGLFASSSGVEPAGAGTATFSLLAGRGEVCGGHRLGRAHLSGCTGLVAGAMFARGRSFVDDRATRLPWVAVPWVVRVEVRIAHRFAAVAGVETNTALLRPTFESIDALGRRRERRLGAMSGAIEVGLSVRLW